MIQNEFKMIFTAFRFRSRTLSMFSNALKMICNAFDRFQNALKWKNGSTYFSLSLVFPNRVTYDDCQSVITYIVFISRMDYSRDWPVKALTV